MSLRRWGWTMLAMGVLACGTAVRPPRVRPVEAIRPGDACARSSFATDEKCERWSRPALNASSPEGCKSDAECKKGFNGRCRELYRRTPDRSGSGPGRNLFGAAPPPPPRTMCVYDECFQASDCGPKHRCACAEEEDDALHRCIAVDECTADSTCGPYRLCHCGDGFSPNTCGGGNCRKDADCDAGRTCESGPTGAFCTTAQDTCVGRSRCPRVDQASNDCTFVVDRARWECVATPYPPPG